jgi:parallel beta-helix repeat protein
MAIVVSAGADPTITGCMIRNNHYGLSVQFGARGTYTGCH